VQPANVPPIVCSCSVRFLDSFLSPLLPSRLPFRFPWFTFLSFGELPAVRQLNFLVHSGHVESTCVAHVNKYPPPRSLLFFTLALADC
jgi:hypothetical protein